MKTVLICHSGSNLTRFGFSRWLASFSDLVGIVEIKEDGTRTKQRIKSEIKRVGSLRFLFDVIPYRVYSKLFDTAADSRWENAKVAELSREYGEIPCSARVLITESPNADSVREFLTALSPDMVIARCKTLIKEEIFSIPPDGTLVLHPGVCPEYRNAHGCFWALANNDLEKVGMTLLKIDAGVDTGPVYGYFTYPYDAFKETPAVIHNRVVYDNLDALKEKLLQIHKGVAEVVDTSGRQSGVWGQPWLSKYLKIKRVARKQ